MSENDKKKAGRKRKGQRADGLVAVYGDFGRKPNGKRNRKAFYGKTWEEANAARQAYKENTKLGISFDSETITVSEWCDKWFAVYKLTVKGTNEASYNAYVNRLKSDVGDALMQDIRHIHLQASLNKMVGMSKSSITKYKMVLQQIFKRARQNNVIRTDPSEGLDVPEGTEGTHRALERWESDYILENWTVYRSGLWMMLMLLAGLRRGEVVALVWENVDLKKRTITVHQAAEIVSNQPKMKDKTKSEAGMRILPICDSLFDALSKTPEPDRKGLVCLSAHKKPLSQSAFDAGVQGFNIAMNRLLRGEYAKQQGKRNDLDVKSSDKQENQEPVENIDNAVSEATESAEPKTEEKEAKFFYVRAHDLRVTFATALYDAGIDVKSAQYYLGHDDIRMTMEIYTRLSRERENLARVKTTTFLDSWFKKEPPVMRNE